MKQNNDTNNNPIGNSIIQFLSGVEIRFIVYIADFPDPNKAVIAIIYVNIFGMNINTPENNADIVNGAIKYPINDIP